MWGTAMGCLCVLRIIKSTKKKEKKKEKAFLLTVKDKTHIWLNWAAYVQVRISQQVLLLVVTTARGISRNSSSSMFHCSAAAVEKKKGCSTSTTSDTCSAETVAVGKCKFLKPMWSTKKCTVLDRKDCSYPGRNLKRGEGNWWIRNRHKFAWNSWYSMIM